MCKTVDWGIGALRENHWNHTTGRHCSMCNCGLRNTETTLVSNIQLCSGVASLPKVPLSPPERTWHLISGGNRATASVTWVEGVAINFLPAISEASCGPAAEQDLVPMAYVPPPREGFVVPNSFLVRNAHLNFYLQSSLYNRETDSRTTINDFHQMGEL